MRAICGGGVAALAFVISWIIAPASVHAEESVRCDNGAYVDRLDRCSAFVWFAPRDDDKTDVRILQAIGGTTPVRSIAIVVGVSAYPNFPEGPLPAAHTDVENLKKFLLNDQHFDELIVLEDAAATKEAINYFLTDYAVTEATAYAGRARILFAFSGHGIEDHAGAALALSDANSTSTSGLFRLRDIQSALQTVAGAGWQVLGLIDACYGGDVFGTGYTGGNTDVYWRTGAYVVTAGPKGELTWTRGDNIGSVFFTAFIDGVEQRLANSFPLESLDPSDSNKIINYGDIITQGQATSEATRVIRQIETGIIRTTIDPAKISEPWTGSIEPSGPSEGAFFFLGKAGAGAAKPIVTAQSTSLALRPVWADNQAKAKSLDDFLIKGIDVSHYDGNPDWEKVKQAGIQFAYVKATQGSNLVDPLLRSNLDGLHAAGLPYGVYATFDFCADPDQQVQNLQKAIPRGSDVLPTVLTVDWFTGTNSVLPPSVQIQLRCANSNPDQTRTKILRVLDRIAETYGKVPVLYIPSISQKLLDDRFSRFPKWVADFSRNSQMTGRPKSSDWAIWQYTDRAHIDGVKTGVDLNVFAGSKSDFERFRSGNPW